MSSINNSQVSKENKEDLSENSKKSIKEENIRNESPCIFILILNIEPPNIHVKINNLLIY